MSRVHPAARAEDAVNAVVARRLRKRGWKLQVLPYTGYAGTGFARLLARVVLARDGQPTTAPTAEDAPTRRGFKVFFTAPLAEVDVRLRCGDATAVATTDRGGYLDVELRDHGLEPGWRTATITVDDLDVEVPIQVISPDTRFGIISDVDDTCLVTTLPRPMIAAWNSFVLEETARKVVPGMPAMYRSLLADQPGAPIFYLSTGAWNTQPILTRFLRRHGFPSGPALLTDWGPTNDSIFRSGQAHKRASLRRLAAEFPHIEWLLVGDDGQHDPVIYEDFAVEHPDNVAAIAIRQLTATQQLLSHGHPLVRDELRGRLARMLVCEGPDGFTLHRLVRKALADSAVSDKAVSDKRSDADA
ncbi:App1 family protein [Flexivirga alba]|uniref:App1 family protein n=1 Tax=Flexivirga alba TaxID=702742 RepID=A0ABW2AD86_9MICO